MHHRTCGINSLLHSVNLIVFTLLLVHLILRISPHHGHRLRSHHLSLPQPFTPDLKLTSFTNLFLHSHSYSSRTAVRILTCTVSKGHMALFVLVSFLATCVKLLYSIVSYRMLTKEPEMLQTVRFASIQCSKMQLHPWLSAANPAGVRGCTPLPQILYLVLRGSLRGVEGRRQGGRREEVM